MYQPALPSKWQVFVAVFVRVTKTLLWLSVVGLLGSLTYGVWIVISQIEKLSPAILQTVQDSDKAAVEAQNTFNVINRPCGTPQPCGTLADVNKTLNTVRKTFGQVEIAAKHENQNLSTLDSQEAKLFGQTSDTLTATKSAISGLIPIEDNFLTVENGFTGVETQAQVTFASVNDYIKSPNFVKLNSNLAEVSGHLDSLTGDISAKTHEFLYPAPCVGKTCWIKRAYTVLRDVGPLSEPFYWGVEAFKGLNK